MSRGNLPPGGKTTRGTILWVNQSSRRTRLRRCPMHRPRLHTRRKDWTIKTTPSRKRRTIISKIWMTHTNVPRVVVRGAGLLSFGFRIFLPFRSILVRPEWYRRDYTAVRTKQYGGITGHLSLCRTGTQIYWRRAKYIPCYLRRTTRLRMYDGTTPACKGKRFWYFGIDVSFEHMYYVRIVLLRAGVNQHAHKHVLQ